LTDDPDVAAKKIMSAAADDKARVAFDRENQPGISNLLQILALLRSTSISELVQEFEGQTSYGEFKKVIAEEVRAFLSDFQQRLQAIDSDQIQAKLIQSETAMNEQA